MATSGPPDPPPYALVPVLLTTIVVLHLTGSGPFAAPAQTWAESFDRTDPIPLAFAVLRVVTLLACYHLLATQALALVGRVVGRAGLIRCADRLTPPPLRTTTRRLAGIGITAVTTLAAPMPRAAATPPPTSGNAVMRAVDLSAGTAKLSIVDPTAVAARGVAGPDQPARTDGAEVAPEPPGSPSGEPGASGTAVVRVDLDITERKHVVRPGDHLWAIAEVELATQLPGIPDDSSVEAYWHQLVLANPQLDDPDLVFPGDVIELPPFSHTG